MNSRDVEGERRPMSYGSNGLSSPASSERKIPPLNLNEAETERRISDMKTKEQQRLKIELEAGLLRERERVTAIQDSEEKQRRAIDNGRHDLVGSNVQGQLWRFGFQDFLDKSEEAGRIIIGDFIVMNPLPPTLNFLLTHM
jgi:hypothetical protein